MSREIIRTAGIQKSYLQLPQLARKPQSKNLHWSIQYAASAKLLQFAWLVQVVRDLNVAIEQLIAARQFPSPTTNNKDLDWKTELPVIADWLVKRGENHAAISFSISVFVCLSGVQRRCECRLPTVATLRRG
jgi:hypothetical protein